RSIPPERLVLLDPSDWQHPFGLNLFECEAPDNPIARGNTVSYVIGIFKKLWGDDGLHPSWGPQLEELLRKASMTFVQAQGYTLIDVPPLLLDNRFRAKVAADRRLTPQLRA